MKKRRTNKDVRRYHYRKITDDIKCMVLARDFYRCVVCNTKHYLTIDHIIPLSKGGSYHEDNLQTLCNRCNTLKRDKVITNAELKELLKEEAKQRRESKLKEQQNIK